MILIHKKLFYEVFNKNIDLYFDFMNIIKSEYSDVIIILKNSSAIPEIRSATHKLVSIISNLLCDNCAEILALCKLLLLNEKNYDISFYLPCVKNIIDYDKTKIGL